MKMRRRRNIKARAGHLRLTAAFRRINSLSIGDWRRVGEAISSVISAVAITAIHQIVFTAAESIAGALAKARGALDKK